MLGNLSILSNRLKKVFVWNLCLLPSLSYAQLHHQTIGALGGSQTKSNYYVSHSVGQSSVVGTSQLNSTLISQGYQQPIFNEYILQPTSNLYKVKLILWSDMRP